MNQHQITRETARVFISEILDAITMQVHKLEVIDRDDTRFVFQYWAGLQQLVILLWRFRAAISLVCKDSDLGKPVCYRLQAFDRKLPSLDAFRKQTEGFRSCLRNTRSPLLFQQIRTVRSKDIHADRLHPSIKSALMMAEEMSSLLL